MEDKLRRFAADVGVERMLELMEADGEYPNFWAIMAEYDELKRENERLRAENEELRRKVEMYEMMLTDVEKARAFLASVPAEVFHSRDLRETNPELKSKIDEAFYTIQRDDLFLRVMKDLPHEIWRDIEGYEGLYQVSNLGRVKSFRRGGRILRGRNDLNSRRFWFGYLIVSLRNNGEEKMFSVHSLVAKAFILNPEGKLEVNHRFGCKTDNRVSELEWVTRSENVRYAYELGLNIPHNRKLSPDDVLYIRKNPENLTYKQLAEKFGMHAESIWKVCNYKSYRNVN